MPDTVTTAGGRIAAVLQDLYDELVAQFAPSPVVPNPVEQLPGVPCVVIYPDTPMAEAGDSDSLHGYDGAQLNLQVLHYSTRMDDRELYARAFDSLEPMRAAVGAVRNATWLDMTAQPVELGGNQYMAAAHTVKLIT